MAKALIVIDVQTKYMDKYDPGLIDRINGRIRKAETEGISIIYVKNMGNPGNEALYSLSDQLYMASEDIYEKRFPSAFTAEAFALRLSELGVKELELIGVDGSSCVAKTAFDAMEKSYVVSIDISCVSSINDKIYEDTLEKLEDAGVNLIGSVE